MDADWITCPHCALKHRPRAQALCPRCGRTSTVARASLAVPTVAPAPVRRAPAMPTPTAAASEYVPGVEYLPEMEPASSAKLSRGAPAPAPAAPSEPATSTLPLGGGLLLLNAVLHLFEFLFLPSMSTNESLRAVQLAGTLVGVGVDTLLGIGLLRGKEQLRMLALLRLVVGLFVFGGMSLYQAQYLFTLVVCAFSCGVLALVWGKPSAFLGGVALTAALLGMTVEIVGFVRLSSSQSLADRARIALRPDLEGYRLLRGSTLVSQRFGYKLPIPSDGWYRHKANLSAPEPHVDMWLSHPDVNGNLMVAVREWNPAEAADLLQARDVALRDLRTRHPDFQVTGTSEGATPGNKSRLATVSGHGTRGGKPFQFELSVYKTGDQLLRVTAFAPVGVFESLELPQSTTKLRPN
ncbi:hypothetical protein [Cystobacter fuscus]|uniref:hypothetical protein n=1 Tax=Cystobacter fuscus TaxID=43 RepID=UPI0002AE2A5D|nr:hypothetical protein [Cystobacter fuscus]